MEGVEAVTKKADFHQAQKDLKELKNPVEKKNGLTQQLELQVDSKKNRSDLKNDDHLFAKPQLIVNTNFPRKNTMEPPEKESNLKNNLQKLATDLSQQEKAIKNKMNLGEPANVDNEVLADFISRANTVLKETEAVTVRKIAEAETKKLLSVSHVTSEPFFGAISNELVQDIWPKTNRWRQISRLNDDSDPVDPKQKRKLEEKIDKTVKTTIKAAGEPLTKKQIGQIRNAAIVYRDFDEIEQSNTYIH
uniref:Uncharacterized protein n=1 Tax=Caenorhabditis japonica TaxID=281687 RepID=A0A8R1HGG5_CAEJA